MLLFFVTNFGCILVLTYGTLYKKYFREAFHHLKNFVLKQNYELNFE
jgi:hypothetical protein